MRIAIFAIGIFAGWFYNDMWRESRRQKVVQEGESYKHLRVVK